MYIDDVASASQGAADHTKLLIEHLVNLGFKIYLEKIFVGLFIDL